MIPVKRRALLLQILYKNAGKYLQYLRQIDKASTQVENALHKSMKNSELIQMLRLEKSLVYFSTSLKSNEIVLEKMLKSKVIQRYPDDLDLLEDVIIENKQAIEMGTIYRDILSGTMDAFASVISNNLNIVMKILTSLHRYLRHSHRVCASLWGMNVGGIPFAGNPLGFFVGDGDCPWQHGHRGLVPVEKENVLAKKLRSREDSRLHFFTWKNSYAQRMRQTERREMESLLEKNGPGW